MDRKWYLINAFSRTETIMFSVEVYGSHQAKILFDSIKLSGPIAEVQAINNKYECCGYRATKQAIDNFGIEPMPFTFA